MNALAGVLAAAAHDSKLHGLTTHIGDPQLHIQGPDGIWPFVVGTVAQRAPLLVVTATGREAQDLVTTLEAMVEDVLYLPAWETLPHERLSPGVETISQRMRVFHRLAHRPPQVVVAPIRAVIQPVQQRIGEVDPIVLRTDHDADFEGLQRRLVEMGYQSVDVVAKHGHFAVRGGMIDVFPATAELPLRIDFWGDEVSEIRAFSAADQRTIADLRFDEVEIYPCRELLLTEEVATRAAELAQTHAAQAELADIFDRISQKIAVQGMEALIPVLSPSPLVPLTSLLPDRTHLLFLHPAAIHRRAHDLLTMSEEFRTAAWEVETGLPVETTSYYSVEQLIHVQRAQSRPVWSATPLGLGDELIGGDPLELDYEPAPRPSGDLEGIAALMDTLRERVSNGGRVAFAAPNPAVAKRMATRFRDAGIATVNYVGSDTPNPPAPAPRELAIYHAVAHAGVDFPMAGAAASGHPSLLFLTETDITGNRVDAAATGKRKPAKRRNRVDPLALEPGDLVVHDTHGIGKFIAVVERTIGRGSEAARREYVQLEYAPSKRNGPGDQLYVPMDQLDQLSRYVGGEKPALSKMGGSDWSATKRKARGAVREIAGELVQLYAARQAAPGYAFEPDNPWQRELEDAFPYTETEDQWQAIEAVKADMEKPVPMDRVIIGDVGYGKTEVAVRAAFKAVQSGKQVAVLVPTTLLAQQHAATFRERMQDFPTTIAELSRFTSAAESKRILEGLADGTVDIVIGTHRLLQTGIQWKSLGLVVIDEEQRFGVEHKEHIKSLRTAVDVLTMSATPIPRTLEMSMAGIREMSTILTPPQDRHPVLTYVGPFEDKQVVAAIRRELLRDGQVFYVHNKVKTINKAAAEIRRLVPEARVVVAHGQMSEEQLETTVQGFWNREFDVLVSTTIVETGLDIANANTLIVDSAHHMGLSQLHQLRGRVGRSRERGYAYFFYPKGAVLTETAYDRLVTIAQNNDLGAGMAVAMKDLEMRGAGNVLGAEQSGHIAGVGFDMYMRMVGEAVQAFRALADGEPIDAGAEEQREVRIDVPIDAHIPVTYVASERLRLEAYRKFAEAQDEEALTRIFEELTDRYGPPPEEVKALAVVARLRELCRQCHVTEVVMVGQKVSFGPLELPDSLQVRLKRLYPQAVYRATAKVVLIPQPKKARTIPPEFLRGEQLVQWCADVLTQLAGLPRREMDIPWG